MPLFCGAQNIAKFMRIFSPWVACEKQKKNSPTSFCRVSREDHVRPIPFPEGSKSCSVGRRLHWHWRMGWCHTTLERLPGWPSTEEREKPGKLPIKEEENRPKIERKIPVFIFGVLPWSHPFSRVSSAILGASIESACPKPHPCKPHPCNMPQAKTEIVLQLAESCDTEIAQQHSCSRLKLQSRLKFQFWPSESEFPTKIGVGGRPAWNFQSRLKSWIPEGDLEIFQFLGP